FMVLKRAICAVERVNSRIGEALNLDRSLSRGTAKLELRCGLCVSAMLTLDVGHQQPSPACSPSHQIGWVRLRYVFI
ncbi:MAG: hypothetical protein KDK78_11270, partial [Chlamydiia bacterium]|nr:hypothetical protein [Chlamydiia bacterium]